MLLHLFFSGKRQIGCFYHYYRNIKDHSINMQIKQKEDFNDKQFLKEIYVLPFKFNKENNSFTQLRNNFNKLGKKI